MTTIATKPPRTREAQLARRCFWVMLACFALARLAARRLPVLETPLYVAGFGAFLAAGYYQLTNPGKPRGAGDGP